MKSKLSNKGYVLLKKYYSDKEIKNIKKELTVAPFNAYQSNFSQTPTFPVYLESVNKLYLPRIWGIDNLGPPDKFKINDGVNIDLKFNGSLRPPQIEAISAYMKNCYPEYGSGTLCLQCGGGKSLSKDSPVIMYDGSIKMIQDVKIGDQLMGDDSTPRNVINLGRGREMMYDIIPTKGEKYTVNESHILSLKCSSDRGNKFKKGKIYDIPLKDYLKLSKSYHYPFYRLKTYRVGVEFETKVIEIDPYYLGTWLVTEQYTFIEILDNYTAKLFKKMNLINNKHIPYNYKCNNRTIRLNLLAGIIDGIANTYHNGYDIVVNSEKLLDDIIYLSRSLGYACYKQIKKNTRNSFIYRTNIHGQNLEKIPVKLKKNKTYPRKQIKDALLSGIKVVPKGIDNYYGVELDGNHRYLLGSFTVTHNTVIGLNIVSELKKKTLIIVHKEFLLNQWIERIKMFLPEAQVGRIQAKKFDIQGKDIVIAMLQSISMKNYEEDAFDSFGFTIVDECFVGSTLIKTNMGLYKIEDLYNKWKNKEKLPLIYSYNIKTNELELKEMNYGWERENSILIEMIINNIKIKCTSNHKFLTNKGYIEANKLKKTDMIFSINEKNLIYISKIESNRPILTNRDKVYDISVNDNHNFIVMSEELKGIIVSNCHHISSEVFSRALPKISTKYTLGLTATPNRTDGLTKVFNWFLGNIVYKGKKTQNDNVYIKVLDYEDENPSYCKIELGFNDKPITARMVNNITNYMERTTIIIETIKQIMDEPTRKILILSDRREHLKLMYEKLTELKFDVGFYLGGMKQKDLDISETKEIILGTFSMSSEALDIPELNTLFMTTPKSNIEQSVGRILRKKHEIRPMIIDIKDNFRPFLNQYKKRCAFYKKCKYQIEEFKIDNNNYKTILENTKDNHNKKIEDNLNNCKKKNNKILNIDECIMSDDDN